MNIHEVFSLVQNSLLFNILLIPLGLYCLAKGADYLVDGSSNIARKFKIPEVIIGLTIVAIRYFTSRIDY